MLVALVLAATIYYCTQRRTAHAARRGTPRPASGVISIHVVTESGIGYDNIDEDSPRAQHIMHDVVASFKNISGKSSGKFKPRVKRVAAQSVSQRI